MSPSKSRVHQEEPPAPSRGRGLLHLRGALRYLLLASLSAGLLTLSQPAFDRAYLAWVALVPLLLALKGRGPLAAFGLSWACGTLFNMGYSPWINLVPGFGRLDFLALSACPGLSIGIFGFLFALVSARRPGWPPVVTAPALWVTTEYLRSNAGFLAAPWALLGHSQYLASHLIQVSSLTGVYGLSFIIVMVNAALAVVVARRFRTLRPLAAPALLLLGVLAYGDAVLRQGSPEGEKMKVTLIQGNVSQADKWDPALQKKHLDRHVALTEKALEGGRSDLVVWSESSVEGALYVELDLLRSVSNLARRTGTRLLLGSSQRPKFGSREFRKSHWYNSAFLLSPLGAVEGRYDKIRLLPFAEYLPLEGFFPWSRRIIAAADHYIPGREYKTFPLGDTRFGVTICWENAFPELVRRFVKDGAGFMVNITNEAWFGETAAPYQFLCLSVFRAAENRVAVLRSANTGVSCFIDPFGRIGTRVSQGGRDTFVEGYAVGTVSGTGQKTFYTLYGDVFAYAILMLSLIAMALSLRPTLIRPH